MGNDSGRAQEPGNQPVVVVAPKRRHFAGFVVVLLVCLGAVGFYRGWFAISTREETQTHKVDINLQVDTGKIKQDTKKVAEKTKEEATQLSAKVKEEAKRLREQSK
jgi:hypothetical protein